MTPIHNKKRKFSNGKLDEEGVNEELNNLRNENEELKRRIEDLEQSSRQPEITAPAETQVLPQESKLVNLIDEKLGDGFNQIHSNLEKLISTKLEVIFQQSKQEINHVTSYGAAVGNKSPAYTDKNLRDIMMETKNEELIEEAERKRRGKISLYME